MRRALRRASAAAPVVFHLPRLDSWAVHRIEAPAQTDDSQADATSPAAGVPERGVEHAGATPYRCGVARQACHLLRMLALPVGPKARPDPAPGTGC